MHISKELLDLLLPSFIVNHFTFLSSSSDQEHLHLLLEFKNRNEYRKFKLSRNRKLL